MSFTRTFFLLLLATWLGGCAAPRKIEPFVLPPPQQAMAPQPDTVFAPMEAAIRSAHGPEASGFRLLDSNEDGLRWRLALVDSARHSIDIQYYIWFGDVSGRLLMKRVFDAADRGVKVRILVDDLNTLLRDVGMVEIRDDVATLIDAHPNIELRLFNAWRNRELAGRAGESVAELERVNQRMHNKAMIVDNQATILGGRNVGDEYMGLHPHFNFHDLDVVGIGPVARQASAVFDLYWNSEWVMPVSALKLAIPKADQAAIRAALDKELSANPKLARIPVAPQTWTAELAALPGQLHIGKSRVYSDVPEDGKIRHEMAEIMYTLFGMAKREILIVNAYIIPVQRSIDGLKKLKDSGVTVRVLTNSLASHDVPAVNSHYKQWRRQIRESVAALHEMRHDAAIQAQVTETPPNHAEFMGLHSKGAVVDRRLVFIGSMNFDPRSAALNTEMGLFVDSPGLAEALAQVIERDMRPENSWRVEIEADGTVTWTNDRETVTMQPARGFMQRVEDVIFMMFPRDLY